MVKKIVLSLLILVCVSVGKCDDVDIRSKSILQQYYKHYIDIDKQTTNRVRINWAVAAIALYDEPDILTKADEVLYDTIEPQKNIFTKTGSEGHDIYWETVTLSRFINSPLADKVSEKTRQTIKALLWDFVKNFDKPGHSEPSLEKISMIYNSDNHDMIHRGVYLMTAQALKNDSAWKNKKYVDGLTPAAHYNVWCKNLMEYFRFRASTGVNAEFGSNCYAAVYLQPILNIYDYCEDKKLAKQAGKFIDLFFADVSQEVLGGVRGGAKVRMYKNALSYNYLVDKLLYYNYILVGQPQKPEKVFPTDCFAMAQSGYRLPDVVKSLMVDTKGKGTYAYKSNRLAQGDHILGNKYGLGESLAPIYTAQSQSGLLRYTYATPSYLLGTFTVDETETYMLINSQNQWMALTTAAAYKSRIVLTLTASSDERTGYRELQAVQDKNCVMFRKQLSANDNALMRLFVSDDFTMSESDGKLIFENELLYVAILRKQLHNKIDYTIEDTDFGPGRFITFTEPNIFIVMEVGQKDEFASLPEFASHISSNRFVFENNHDEAIYESGNSCRLKMYTNNRVPLVNGNPVDLRPKKVYDSPYLQSEYGSGIVTVKSPNSKKITLDFNYE